jgi:hypothetical protein
MAHFHLGPTLFECYASRFLQRVEIRVITATNKVGNDEIDVSLL